MRRISGKSNLIFRKHEKGFKRVHSCRHHSLHAIVQGKAEQEEHAGVQQSGGHGASKGRCVLSSTRLKDKDITTTKILPKDEDDRLSGLFVYLGEDVSQSVESQTSLLDELTARQQEQLLEGISRPLWRHDECQSERWRIPFNWFLSAEDKQL